jgi:hypothetical protein
MQFYQPSKSKRSALVVIYTAAALSHSALSLSADPSVDAYADKILNRANTDPRAIDRNADGQVDVRDLAIYIDGQPTFATFGSAESIAFASDGSVTLPIFFSKPIQGTVRFDLGGTALATGVDRDVTLLQNEIVLNAPSSSAEITILIEPWKGVGGEKIVRLSLKRDPVVLPANGTFPSHILRLRQFDAGEFAGMLTFPPSSGLPALPVRIGLDSGGLAVCSFQNPNTLLGEKLDFAWNAGFQGFPNLTGSSEVVIPKETFNRGSDVTASLAIQRMASPYPEDIVALLEGFPSEGQPAVYHANLVFPDLFAAGSGSAGVSSGSLAITYEGRLIINPVTYSEAP